MLKLLLNSDRYALRTEYKFRLFNAFLFFFFLATVITGALFFPPYIFVQIEKTYVEKQANNFKNSDTSKQIEEISILNEKIGEKYLMFKNLSINPTEIIIPIVVNQPKGISIESFSLTKVENEEDENQISIELRGVAKDRETLVLFSDKLKEEKIFKKVDLPFSNLTKNTEIPFTFSIQSGFNQEKS